jgi:tRNA A37 threonylcarbamoyladenosine biosynthesis protein TsaE
MSFVVPEHAAADVFGPRVVLVGREGELAQLEGYLDRVGTASGALLLTGEMGIGKTVLLQRGAQLAAARGYRC